MPIVDVHQDCVELRAERLVDTLRDGFELGCHHGVGRRAAADLVVVVDAVVEGEGGLATRHLDNLVEALVRFVVLDWKRQEVGEDSLALVGVGVDADVLHIQLNTVFSCGDSRHPTNQANYN